MGCQTRKQLIKADREAGMTYSEIARKHGVSEQYAAQVCGKSCPGRFHVIKKESCIYPNLRKWMNENRCSRYELVRRMGYEALPGNSARLSEYMAGNNQPRKPYIDKLLKATGMTYEVLFAMEDER